MARSYVNSYDLNEVANELAKLERRLLVPFCRPTTPVFTKKRPNRGIFANGKRVRGKGKKKK